MHPLIQILIGIFIADYFIAFFHWFEDTYFSYCMKIPIISAIAKDNEMHHYYPRDIVSYSYFENMSVTLPLSICICIIIFAISPSFFCAYKYMIIAFFILGSVSNIFHKFTHMRDCECPSIIKALQNMGVLIKSSHHKKHHDQPSHKYGVIFPFTNYILDTIGAWRALEAMIFLMFGIKATVKLPYSDYVDAVKYTSYHENSVKNPCPSKLTYEQLEDLKQHLGNFYRCGVTSNL